MKPTAAGVPAAPGRPLWPWRLLQTRLTLLVLGLVLVAVWTLAALGSRQLHADLERLVSEQQQSALAVFADELNQQLERRLTALENVARRITPAVQKSPSAPQATLAERPGPQALFNGGCFSVDDQDVITVAAQACTVIAASDRTLILKSLAPPGVDPVLDRVLIAPRPAAAGRPPWGSSKVAAPRLLEDAPRPAAAGRPPWGSSKVAEPRLLETGEANILRPRDEQAQEVLMAAHGIPFAGWVLISQLPTHEAFQPVHNLWRNTLLSALAVPVLAMLGSAWLVRHQPAPLRKATLALARQGQGEQPPAPLPVGGPDELGALIDGSGDGLWDRVVQAARTHYSRACKPLLGGPEGEPGTGFEEWTDRLHPDDRAALMAALEDHLQGRTEACTHEFRMRCHDGSHRWTLGRGVVVARGSQGEPLRVIGTHHDITTRRAAAGSQRQPHDVLMRVIEKVPARFFWKGTDLRYIGCNAAFAHDAGEQGPADVIGKLDHALGWARQAEQYDEDDRNIMRTGRGKLQYLELQTRCACSRRCSTSSATP